MIYYSIENSTNSFKVEEKYFLDQKVVILNLRRKHK